MYVQTMYMKPLPLGNWLYKMRHKPILMEISNITNNKIFLTSRTRGFARDQSTKNTKFHANMSKE